MEKENKKEIWSFVKKSEYSLPDKPATEKARSFVSSIWNNIFSEEKQSSKVDIQTELHSVPQKLLDTIAPYPDWQNAVKLVEEKLQHWVGQTTSDELFKIFIAPNGSGLHEILAELAAFKEWEIVKNPEIEQLMGRDFSWLSDLKLGQNSLVVIPQLDKFFLRHHNGIEQFRLFLTKLVNSKQRCIIGCNSWLWQFLTQAMHFSENFSEPYFLQSLGAKELQDFFCQLELQNGVNLTVFRQTDVGSFVLPMHKTYEGKIPEKLKDEYEAKKADFPTLFMKKLALHSRGIPLVAWSIWRSSLNMAPEEEVAEAAKDAAAADRGKTIWVKPFEKISKPEVPSGLGRSASFILQLLLIQDGLPQDIIYKLLDFDKDAIAGTLYRLRQAGVLLFEKDIWRVSWIGYSEVRRYLSQEDYLLDSM
ncbi:MAG: hypothetical protein ACQETH_05600 [Candidatus Rifleibacteriota bacterium]